MSCPPLPINSAMLFPISGNFLRPMPSSEMSESSELLSVLNTISKLTDLNDHSPDMFSNSTSVKLSKKSEIELSAVIWDSLAEVL